MTKAKHSPGPWAVHPDFARVIPAEHVNRPIGAHEDPEIDRERYAQEICAMHWPDNNRNIAEVRANASLIAAAPDMLAALQAAMLLLREYDFPGAHPHRKAIYDQAKAAIAKAAGEHTVHS